MKKLKLPIMIVAIIAIGIFGFTLMFSSHKKVDVIELSDIINEDATFKSKNQAFTKMNMISDLEGAVYKDWYGDLTYFTILLDYNESMYRHIIYNAKTNRVVAKFEDTYTKSHTVTLR